MGKCQSRPENTHELTKMKAHGKKSHIIYLVTPGQSIGNYYKMFLKQEHDYLTKAGEVQAVRLGKFLSKKKITRIFYSDHPIAYDTAHTILRFAKKSGFSCPEEVKQDTLLQERGVEAFNNKSYSEFSIALGKDGGDLMTFEHEGCETMKMLENRIHYFFMHLCAKLDKSELTQEVVVIVSHPYVLTTLVNKIIGCEQYIVSDWKPIYRKSLLRNASFIKLSVSCSMDSTTREVLILNVSPTKYCESLVNSSTSLSYATNSRESRN